MAQKIQLRGDTAAAWTAVNPVLLPRELGLETDSMLYKIGNGTAAWNALPYRALSGELAASLLMTVLSVDPAAPADTGMRMWAGSFAGRALPEIRGATGQAVPLQPALWSSGHQIALAGSGAAFTYIGMGALTAVGTVAHPAITTGAMRTHMRRATVTSAATASSISHLRQSVAMGFRGDGVSQGGFFFHTRFAESSITALQRGFTGLHSSLATIAATTTPTALTNCIGIGHDSADVNMQILHNDATGTCTKVDLGINFVANVPTSVFDLTLFARPSDTSKVSWAVRNLTSGATASGDITTDLPDASTLLTYHSFLANGGTAAAVVLETMRMHFETDH